MTTDVVLLAGPNPVALAAYRPQIAAALAYAGQTHQYDDVARMVAAGAAQAWPGPASIIITEVIDHPRIRCLHFFLAGGLLSELQAMTPFILQWGRDRGCQQATLLGRKGWQRSFLAETGWTVRPLVLMEVPL